MPGLILVIEDEPGIVDFVQRGLAAQGFEVISAPDGESGLQRALKDDVGLVVLDMMLPGRDGRSVLGELRDRRPDLPVIALTALSDVEDRVAGLDAGAADYIAKPFSLAELAARVRAQLRVAAQMPQTNLSAGGIDIDLLTREVKRGAKLIRLSTTEFELLAYLVRNRGRVLSREQILRAVWGYDYDPGTNVVDVYVGYLRRKLGLGASERVGDRRRADGPPEDREPAAAIVTIRSVGYRFDAHN